MSILPLQIEIDKIDRSRWDYLITHFNDASICQTWPYNASSKRRVSSIVIKAGEEILGCCLVRILHLPFSNLGFADIMWGPLCVRDGKAFNPDVLRHLMRGIKEEYAIRRGYLLRIWPHAIDERKELLKQILESEGFNINPLERPYRTFKIDLSPPLEDLRKNFSASWRRNLNKAEKMNLRVIEGTSGDLFTIFAILSKEMWRRKNRAASVDNQFYQHIQEELPDPIKMLIKICYADDVPVCAIVCSSIGDTGIYLLGASGEKALELNSSYLLQWEIIKWLKANGFRYYDLGAFNPELNPGGYQFKRGIAGKNGWEEKFLGEYHGCFNLTGRTSKFLLNFVKYLRGIF